jgi:hypothetical protein
MQMSNYWEMVSAKGLVIAILILSQYPNTLLSHIVVAYPCTQKNSYYWTLMCPIFAQKHLGSCKWK